MFSQEDLSNVDVIKAKIQARVALFLSLKDRLLLFMRSPNLTLQNKAKNLYANQLVLENDLTNVYKMLDRFEAGTFSFSDLIDAADFYYRMEKHIADVQDLEIEYEKVTPPSEYQPGLPKWALWAGLGLLAFILLK